MLKIFIAACYIRLCTCCVHATSNSGNYNFYCTISQRQMRNWTFWNWNDTMKYGARQWRNANNLQIGSKLHIKRIIYYSDHVHWVNGGKKRNGSQKSWRKKRKEFQWNVRCLIKWNDSPTDQTIQQTNEIRVKHGNRQKHNAINGCGSVK